MKSPVSLFVFIFCTAPVFGQLQAHAGKDTTFCLTSSGYDTMTIGGNPAASGGVGPYSYAWSTRYKLGSGTYGASFFLDDTTLSNPSITNPALDMLTFRLTVTDKEGSSAADSITIRFSRFLNLGLECIYMINKGDTVSLFCSVTKGMGPLTYSWSPDYHITDTATSNPQVWPDTSTAYHVYVTDSIGCVSETQTCSVTIKPTGMIQMENNPVKSIVFPNPVNENSTLLLDTEHIDGLTLQILTGSGQTVVSDRITWQEYALGKKIQQAGLYFYVIKNGSEIVSKGQFVKK